MKRNHKLGFSIPEFRFAFGIPKLGSYGSSSAYNHSELTALDSCNHSLPLSFWNQLKPI